MRFSLPKQKVIKGNDHDIIISSPIESQESRRKSFSSSIKTSPFIIYESSLPKKSKKVDYHNSFSISNISKSDKTIPKDFRRLGFKCDASLSQTNSVAPNSRNNISNSRIQEEGANLSLAMVFKESRKLLRQKHRRLSREQLFKT